MTLASHAIFPAPPASGADLVDRHWAVSAMHPARRLATLAAATQSSGPLADAGLRDAAHTLATAYELAALLGRDALRSGSLSATAELERAALRVGAERANLLHRALGFVGFQSRDAVQRHAARVCALATVAGPECVAHTRTWVHEANPHEEGPDPAGQHDGETQLWMIWCQLLLHPDTATLDRIIDELAAMREQRRSVPEIAPSSNEAELRLRFHQFVSERLADAAGLLALGLRGRGQPQALAAELGAHCTAARSASTGDPSLDLLAAWLELAAITALAPRLQTHT